MTGIEAPELVDESFEGSRIENPRLNAELFWLVL